MAERIQGHVHRLRSRLALRGGSQNFGLGELIGGFEGIQRGLAAAGEDVRLYLPFGRDWWPYAVRRVGENPRNAWLVTKALISRQ